MVDGGTGGGPRGEREGGDAMQIRKAYGTAAGIQVSSAAVVAAALRYEHERTQRGGAGAGGGGYK